MKKLILLFVTAVLSFSAHADEGMWLLPYLQKMNIKDMQAKGCKLSAEDIYSLNNSSLKDAIVTFGRGCTGEIVSREGLLFTNHHCGYESIQQLSSVDKDYLKYGFWAMSNQEEIHVPGLEVRFIRQIIDATSDVLGNVPNISGKTERDDIVAANIDNITTRLRDANPGMEVSIKPFFGGNQYFAFVSEVFTDIRLVGTPPESIGKFGGDTDNWMWPRHTGDFSIFRVYASQDNKPADYSINNTPYKTDKFLKVSIDGYKEGDFAMIMGFPGSTQRYMTSHEIDQMMNVTNPQRIFIRGERQNILKEDMVASDKVRIQYSSKYANSSNGWKNSIGMSRGIEKLNVRAQKEAQEAEFQQWAQANTLPEEGFIDALSKIKGAVEVLTPIMARKQYMKEAIIDGVEILAPGSVLFVMNSMNGKIDDNMRKRFLGTMDMFYKDYNPSTDRKVIKRMLHIMRENVKELPSIYTNVIDKDFGGDIDAYVDHLFANSITVDEAKMRAFIDNYSVEIAKNDPVLVLFESIFEANSMSGAEAEIFQKAKDELADGHRLYIAGLMRMQPQKAWASDANFTMRLTYGQVLPYNPADGIRYEYFTTMKGIMEKEDASNPDFVVHEKLKELYAAGDYGQYADADGTLHVAFLANCDITGGNSGSPVLNDRGELIGLAFDGNWEAMSGDVAFEPELQRTIVVDSRYVLFVIDKFAGAGHLLKEMEIVKQAPKKSKRK